jgi:hypothetical protein
LLRVLVPAVIGAVRPLDPLWMRNFEPQSIEDFLPITEALVLPNAIAISEEFLPSITICFNVLISDEDQRELCCFGAVFAILI